MKNAKIFSASLVVAQFFLITVICLQTFPLKPGTSLPLEILPGIALIGAACILAIVAALTLRLDNFSVMPEPVNQGVLITSGPYRYIRHPMYTAVLMGCTGMLLLNANPLGGALLIALCAVLLLKIKREESLLQATYSGYSAYRENTSALLPMIF